MQPYLNLLSKLDISSLFIFTFSYVNMIKIQKTDQFSANLESCTMQKTYALQIELHSVKILHCHHTHCVHTYEPFFPGHISYLINKKSNTGHFVVKQNDIEKFCPYSICCHTYFKQCE